MIPLGTLLLLAFVLTGVYLRTRRGVKERSMARRRSSKDDCSSTTYVHPEKFTLAVLRVATGNFAAENKLGEGGFGHVFKVHTSVTCSRISFQLVNCVVLTRIRSAGAG